MKFFLQPRHPQVDRPRPDRHQRQATRSAPPLLQEQEVRSSRPPREADPCHPPPVVRRRRCPRHREGQEAHRPLPSTQVRREGQSNWISATRMRLRERHGSVEWCFDEWDIMSPTDRHPLPQAVPTLSHLTLWFSRAKETVTDCQAGRLD